MKVVENDIKVVIPMIPIKKLFHLRQEDKNQFRERVLEVVGDGVMNDGSSVNGKIRGD